MAVLPAEVSNAWDDREGPAVFTTVDGEGIPNAIYANCVRKYGKDTLVVADNYFYKTRANILAGSPAPSCSSPRLENPIRSRGQSSIT